MGLGARGVYFGGRIFGGMKNCRIVALNDVRQDKIDAAQKALGSDIFSSTSAEEFLNAPGLDAVVVASPDHAHKECAVKILNAGKHLFLEKPMAQTIEDCDAIIEAWQGSETVFTIGLELRYCTLMRDLKKIIDSGVIGKIIMGSAIDNVSVGGNYYFHGSRRRREYIKSLILEKGTHTLDLMNWLINSSPVKVYSSAGLDVFGGDAPNDLRCRDCAKKDSCEYFVDSSNFKMDYDAVINDKPDFCVYARECDVPDNGILLVDYENGARMSYMECHFTPEYSREFMFIGAKGKITAFYNNEQEFRITVRKRHERKETVYFPERSEGGHGGGDPMIAEEFIRRIMEGKSGMFGVKGARDSAAIAIASIESEQTGLPVEIPKLDIEMN
jgi:predicted dehydrogenase